MIAARKISPDGFQLGTVAFDILLALKGQDSYAAGFWSGLFGGSSHHRPYFSGGQRRGFTIGLPAHRSFFWGRGSLWQNEEKAKIEPDITFYPLPKNTEALRLRTVNCLPHGQTHRHPRHP
jgi:hypothetical protein